MQSTENKQFWAMILAFLESGRPVATLHQALSRAANIAERALLFEDERMALPTDDPAHESRWAGVREFFQHPDIVDRWPVETTIDQLTRVARGERANISDNCVSLPLYH
ncbi:hypothetical protein KBA73_00475 [Patescibacteria group bacterium]|nr:hypothetical protein [Patescibacteria group bacterium]